MFLTLNQKNKERKIRCFFRCILVSDHSHLSWMEFLDYALGFYMDNLAGCRCIICCAFRHYEIRSWRKGINLVLPEVLY